MAARKQAIQQHGGVLDGRFAPCLYAIEHGIDPVVGMAESNLADVPTAKDPKWDGANWRAIDDKVR